MLSIRESSLAGTDQNAALSALPRAPDEGNRAWVQRAFAEPPFAAAGLAIVLIGGRTSLDLTLRFAQALARYDRTPSSWSEAALLIRGKAGKAVSYGIHLPRLDQPVGYRLSTPKRLLRNVPTWNNGVQQEVLKHVDDPIDYPNIALLGFGETLQAEMLRQLPPGEPESATPQTLANAASAAVQRYRKRPDVVSSAEAAWRWLGYAWGVREQPNPLHQGMGLPSALFVETVIAALGLDLTPGLASHSSCPEAIWQTAKWWYAEQAAERRPGADTQSAPTGPLYFGRYHRGHVMDEPGG